MTLYEITDEKGEILKDTVTIKEASEMLNSPVNSLYGAAAEDRLIKEKYRIRATDKTISRKRDQALLAEFDIARLRLLRVMRK